MGFLDILETGAHTALEKYNGNVSGDRRGPQLEYGVEEYAGDALSSAYLLPLSHNPAFKKFKEKFRIHPSKMKLSELIINAYCGLVGPNQTEEDDFYGRNSSGATPQSGFKHFEAKKIHRYLDKSYPDSEHYLAIGKLKDNPEIEVTLKASMITDNLPESNERFWDYELGLTYDTNDMGFLPEKVTPRTELDIFLHRNIDTRPKEEKMSLLGREYGVKIVQSNYQSLDGNLIQAFEPRLEINDDRFRNGAGINIEGLGKLLEMEVPKITS